MTREHLPLDEHDHRHGSTNGYVNLACRCARCRRAQADYVNDARERRRRLGLKPGDRRHGTPNGYTNWMCRCRECLDAHAAEARATRIR